MFSALHTFCSSRFFGKQVKKPHDVSLPSNTVEKENKEKTDPMRALQTCCFRSRVIYLVPTCTVELHRACLKPHLIPD